MKNYYCNRYLYLANQLISLGKQEVSEQVASFKSIIVIFKRIYECKYAYIKAEEDGPDYLQTKTLVVATETF